MLKLHLLVAFAATVVGPAVTPALAQQVRQPLTGALAVQGIRPTNPQAIPHTGIPVARRRGTGHCYDLLSRWTKFIHEHVIPTYGRGSPQHRHYENLAYRQVMGCFRKAQGTSRQSWGTLPRPTNPPRVYSQPTYQRPAVYPHRVYRGMSPRFRQR